MRMQRRHHRAMERVEHGHIVNVAEGAQLAPCWVRKAARPRLVMRVQITAQQHRHVRGERTLGSSKDAGEAGRGRDGAAITDTEQGKTNTWDHKADKQHAVAAVASDVGGHTARDVGTDIQRKTTAQATTASSSGRSGKRGVTVEGRDGGGSVQLGLGESNEEGAGRGVRGSEELKLGEAGVSSNGVAIPDHSRPLDHFFLCSRCLTPEEEREREEEDEVEAGVRLVRADALAVLDCVVPAWAGMRVAEAEAVNEEEGKESEAEARAGGIGSEVDEGGGEDEGEVDTLLRLSLLDWALACDGDASASTAGDCG